MDKHLKKSSSPVLPVSAPRMLFIDNIRWVIIMLVLSMHAAVTYSNQGGWYYCEPSTMSRTSLILLIFYQSFLQSFFMGLLFFLSGYFVPKAYDSKGSARFLKDRAIRLGLPTLLYVFIIGPLTEYYVSFSWHPDPVDRSFVREYTYYLTRFRFLGGTGPLWFCAALLIFCLMYVLYRILSNSVRAKDLSTKFPTNTMVCFFVILTGFVTFLVRIPWPKGRSFFNMQLAYFSQYILFFVAGILAYRGNWLVKIPKKYGICWGIVSVVGGPILWISLLIAGGAFHGTGDLFQGGLYWQSLGLSIWESIVGVGMSIFLVVLFRENFNDQGRIAKFFSNNAFAVYVFHPPVLIMIARLMNNLHWPALVKFPLLTILSITISFLLCGLLIRRVPFFKRIM